jgi:hypothetical protein
MAAQTSIKGKRKARVVTSLIQKLLTYCFSYAGIRWHSLLFPLSFFLDVYLGCHQLSAAETHT